MKIEDLKNQFGFINSSTGGNCEALHLALPHRNGEILITSNDCQLPTDEDDNFYIGVYLNDEYGEPEEFTELEQSNIAELYEEVVKILSGLKPTQAEFYNLPEVKVQLEIQKQNRYSSAAHRAAYSEIGEIAKRRLVWDQYQAADGGDY